MLPTFGVQVQDVLEIPVRSQGDVGLGFRVAHGLQGPHNQNCEALHGSERNLISPLVAYRGCCWDSIPGIGSRKSNYLYFHPKPYKNNQNARIQLLPGSRISSLVSILFEFTEARVNDHAIRIGPPRRRPHPCPNGLNLQKELPLAHLGMAIDACMHANVQPGTIACAQGCNRIQPYLILNLERFTA